MVAPNVQTQEKPKMAEVVVVEAEPTEEHPDAKWSSKHVVVAAVGFLCCNLLGLPALLMAIFSYVDHSNRHYAESSAKRRRAKCLGIFAIVMGTLLLAGFIAWHFCPERNKHHRVDKAFRKDYPMNHAMKEGHADWERNQDRPYPGRHHPDHDGMDRFLKKAEEMRERIKEEMETE